MLAFADLEAPLREGQVELRLGAERDIPEILIAHQDDRRLHQLLGLDRPPSGAELGRGFEAAAVERARGTGVRLTILEAGSDVCRGQILTSNVSSGDARADLRMWLAPQVRGRGLAVPALRLASRWLLSECDVERLQILIELANLPMLATARAAGYTEEGTLRAYARTRAGRRDCAILSLVRSDLAAARR